MRRLGFENKDQCLFIGCRMVVQRRAPDHPAVGLAPLPERACAPIRNAGPNIFYAQRYGHLLWGIVITRDSLTLSGLLLMDVERLVVVNALLNNEKVKKFKSSHALFRKSKVWIQEMNKYNNHSIEKGKANYTRQQTRYCARK